MYSCLALLWKIMKFTMLNMIMDLMWVAGLQLQWLSCCMKTCQKVNDKFKAHLHGIAWQRLKRIKILLLVHYYMFTLPESRVQFNCTSRENCQRKSQYCSDPLGSDHLRQAEKVQFEPAAWNSHICDTAKKCWLLSDPDLQSMFHVWSERIQTVHRDIQNPQDLHKWNN